MVSWSVNASSSIRASIALSNSASGLNPPSEKKLWQCKSTFKRVFNIEDPFLNYSVSSLTLVQKINKQTLYFFIFNFVYNVLEAFVYLDRMK